jgi:hypothetical protein
MPWSWLIGVTFLSEDQLQQAYKALSGNMKRLIELLCAIRKSKENLDASSRGGFRNGLPLLLVDYHHCPFSVGGERSVFKIGSDLQT